MEPKETDNNTSDFISEEEFEKLKETYPICNNPFGMYTVLTGIELHRKTHLELTENNKPEE